MAFRVFLAGCEVGLSQHVLNTHSNGTIPNSVTRDITMEIESAR